MNTFAEQPASPARSAAPLDQFGLESGRPVQRATRDFPEGTGLQAAINRRESVQSNRQTGRALDGSPRVTAQTRLAAALAARPVLRMCKDCAEEEKTVQTKSSPTIETGSPVQLARKRRKDFKNERQRLATEKRMGPVRDSMEQMEEEQAEAAYEADFDQYLNTGMQLILGEDTGGIGVGVRFGSYWQAFDKRYWTVEEEADTTSDTDSQSGSESDEEPEYKLVLKPGVKPAAAIDFLFANLNLWALDCADAIQVARWYAMRHAMGAEEFNQTMKGMEFALKSHDSTGLHDEGMYLRTNADDEYDIDETLKFKRDGSDEKKVIRTPAETIIRRAPIGTRLLLTTDDDDAAGTDYENENVVKIGPDLYAAHPMGVGTLDWMILEVAKTALDIDEQTQMTPKLEKKLAAMRKKIYISEIELIRKR